MFLSLICTRHEGEAKASSNAFIFPSYGFQAGGTYNFHISCDAKEVQFGFLSEAQSKITKDEFVNHMKNSTIVPFIARKMGEKTEDDLVGTIEEKGVYIPFVVSTNSSKFKFKFDLTLRNKDYFMDYRYEPKLYTDAVMLGLTFIVVVAWFINWFCNFNVQIYIHYLFTAQFGIILLSDIMDLIYTLQIRKSDNDFHVTWLSLLISLFRSIILFVVILLTAKGWGIILDTIKLKDLAWSLVISLLSAVFLFFAQYFYVSSVVSIVFIIISIILLGIYLFMLKNATEDSALILMAHNLVIKNAGIDPTTTPIQKKQDMYKYFQYTFNIYLVLILVRLIVIEFLSNVFWLKSFLVQLSDFIWIALFYFIFRIKDKENNGYTAISESVGEEFVITDLENAAQDDDDDHSGIEWTPGMKLPSRPSIVKTPTVAIIESPDGNEEVNISVEENNIEETNNTTV